MLEIKIGNIFDNLQHQSLIAHGCNAKGAMNSGVAKQVRYHYPENFLLYRQAFLEDGLKLNDVILYTHVEKDKTIHIANLITQEEYGYDENVVYVNYDAVEHTLRVVKDYAAKSNLSVNIPFIGGGMAHGDRTKLLKIFKEVFDDYPATLWMPKDKFHWIEQAEL